MTSPQSFPDMGYVHIGGCINRLAVDDARRWIMSNLQRTDLASTRDLFDRARTQPIKVRKLWSEDRFFWRDFLARSGTVKEVRAWIQNPLLLTRTAAFIKYPRSRAVVGWHCDEDLWGHSSQRGLTAWIPLTTVTEDSGCLQFFPGSHLRPPGRLYWDPTHPYHKVMEVADLAAAQTVTAEIGDCILIDKRCVHSSGPNVSTSERIGLVFAFANCGRNEISEPAVPIRGDHWLELEPLI